jgi:hypothetical protein
MAPTQPAVAPDLDLLLRANRRAMSERQSEGMQSVQNAFRHLTVESSSEAAPVTTSVPADPVNVTRERNRQSRIVLGRALDVLEADGTTLDIPSQPSPINTSRYATRCLSSAATS